MSHRFYSAGITRCKRRRTWWQTALDVATLIVLAALCGWLWSCVRQAGAVSSFRFQVSGWTLAMAPVMQGSILGLLALVIVVGVALAVRKVKRDEKSFASLRREEDVFAPLREPGRAVPPEEAQRILVACAAEARNIMQHVRRAQRTLSIEDYGDELLLAEQKLDGVIRCVEALAARTTACGTPGKEPA